MLDQCKWVMETKKTSIKSDLWLCCSMKLRAWVADPHVLWMRQWRQSQAKPLSFNTQELESSTPADSGENPKICSSWPSVKVSKHQFSSNFPLNELVGWKSVFLSVTVGATNLPSTEVKYVNYVLNFKFSASPTSAQKHSGKEKYSWFFKNNHNAFPCTDCFCSNLI